jgi:hypothetical protein
MYEDLARMWKRCSLQMHRLCTAGGMEYYHFLQPNQYLPGSKPMGEEEISVAIRENHPYRTSVEQGYPCLIAQGRDLAARGVHFFDMTMIFENDETPLYDDDCCHLNSRGYNMIASFMAGAILENSAALNN